MQTPAPGLDTVAFRRVLLAALNREYRRQTPKSLGLVGVTREEHFHALKAAHISEMASLVDSRRDTGQALAGSSAGKSAELADSVAPQ